MWKGAFQPGGMKKISVDPVPSATTCPPAFLKSAVRSGASCDCPEEFSNSPSRCMSPKVSTTTLYWSRFQPVVTMGVGIRVMVALGVREGVPVALGTGVDDGGSVGGSVRL